MKVLLRDTVLYVIIFIFSTPLYSQTKQGNHWYFGQYASIDFNSGKPVAGNSSAMRAYGGCTSVSDENGKLLFYTNGAVVYNALHDTMKNGTGLMTDWGTYGNWGQSVIAIKRPEISDYYYIFTVYRKYWGSSTYPESMRYCRVYMKDQNGLGSVNKRNTILELGTFEAKLTTVNHSNGKDIWIIAKEQGSKKFYSYLVTKYGVSINPVISPVGNAKISQYYWYNGSMKASADGKYVAVTRTRDYLSPDTIGVELYKFNDSSGTLSSFAELSIPNDYYWSYGSSVEFSPDGTKLYVSDQQYQYGIGYVHKVFQFELRDYYSAHDVQTSRYTVADVSLSSYGGYLGTMQLAPDGKIYIARWAQKYLSVINAPNQRGSGCCYEENAVSLGSNSCMNGLPNIPSSWYKNEVFTWESDCFGDSIPFRIYNETCLDSVHWEFGDTASGSENYSTALRPKHYYTSSGKFDVTAITYRQGFGDSATLTIEVYPFPVPKIGVDDASQCFNDHEFNFIDSSTIDFTEITYYYWDMGDNNVVQGKQNFKYKYADTGRYNVTLILASEYGCKDTISRDIYVYPNPVAKMNLEDTTQCLNGNLIHLIDSSFIISGNYSNSWLFQRNDSLLTYYDSIAAPRDTTYVFNDADTFKLTYYAVSDKGCTDDTSTIISIYPSPVSNFTINDSIQCVNANSFYFTSTATIPNDTLTYFWKFGDGDTATTKNASHIYTSYDTFTVSLTVISSLGCQNTMSKNVYVRPNPLTDFKINDSTQCLYTNQFNFTNTTTIAYDNLSHLWDLGDSNTSTKVNPVHVYNSYNKYFVKLIVSSEYGCIDSTIKKIIINPNPIASFNVNDSLQCLAQNNFVFTNNTSIPLGTLNYEWDFGDNQTANNSGTTYHTYSNHGLYTVKLVAVSNEGCKDSTSMNIEVAPMPQVNFSVKDNMQCLNTNNFKFNNKSSIAGGTMDYLWDFGDQSSSTAVSPKHIYSTDDTFSVKLIARSNLECIDSLEKPIYVFPSPVSDFMVNDTSQCFNEHQFVFTNQSSIKNGALTYLWNFGDGSLSLGEDPKYHYSIDDTFTVKLISISPLGCKDSVSKTIYLYPSPTANFIIPDSQQCLVGNYFDYQNYSSISSGSLSYFWDFDNNSYSTLFSLGNSFTNDDTFNVKLVVTSALGCQDSLIQKAYVFPNPIPRFGINDTSQCFERNNFIFYNNSTINSGTQTFYWAFGDGHTSTAVIPNHSYSYPDTFNVKLVATSDFGCKDSVERTTLIHVHPMPVAQFSIVDSAQCLSGNSFSFTDLSSIAQGYMTFEWFFGDGDSSNVQNANHSFNNHDTFDVKLMAISDWGCKDSAIRNVIVFPQPQPEFDINDEAQCLSGNHYDFTNQSTIVHGSLVSFVWKFGDGSSDTQTNASKSFSTYDTFYVQLSATSVLGCVDSIIKPIAVHPMPVVDFTINDSDQCLKDNKFILSDISTIAYDSIADQIWHLSDFTSLQGTPVNHTFNNYDTFEIKLLATSTLGCTDSNIKYIYVRPMPIANFSINDDEQCLSSNLFKFMEHSGVVYGSLDSFSWNFDDGNSSEILNPDHTYSIQDTYQVKLTVTSNYGCKHDTSDTLIVRPNPIANFDINDSSQCLTGNNFVFNNLTHLDYGSMVHQWYFGDGIQSSDDHPDHQYARDTVFDVKLLVVSNYGCMDSFEKIVIVHPMPMANFSYSDLCLEQDIQFSDISTINAPDIINAWDWDFGNTASTLQHPVNLFNTAGNKTIRLTVSSNNNCENSQTKHVYINEHVIAPKVLTVTVEDEVGAENGYIHIEWEEVSTGVPEVYIIEKSTDGINYTEIDQVDHNTFEYNDHNVLVDEQSYYYRLLVKDSCDYVSPDAAENFGKSILLSVDDNESPELEWTLYDGWINGISFQDIYVYEHGYYAYQLVDEVDPETDHYIDDKTSLNVDKYCYQISATGVDNGVSNSNILCVPTTFYLWVPNAFTPNGDVHNPVFKAIGKNVIEFEISIYNRWGQKVFYSRDIDKGWDGTYQGSLCETGVYTYIIKAKGTQFQGKRINGHLTLIR